MIVSHEEVRKLEKDYEEYEGEVADLRKQLFANMRDYKGAYEKSDHPLCVRVRNEIQNLKEEMSSLEFAHQDDLYELEKMKSILNSQARAAYLNKIRSGAKVGEYFAPYPEVTGV